MMLVRYSNIILGCCILAGICIEREPTNKTDMLMNTIGTATIRKRNSLLLPYFFAYVEKYGAKWHRILFFTHCFLAHKTGHLDIVVL